jgi:protein-tyrosine phosphatase
VRTELHFHLLPGVDDGPRDDAEALELARLAVADGTGRVVATPHVRDLDLDELPARTEALRERLRDAGVDLQVCWGGELSVADAAQATDAELDAVAHGPAGRRWVLLEAPLRHAEHRLRDVADALRARGYASLIAHPERSPAVTMDELRALVAQGAVLQVNASSLAGGHGAEARERALRIARSGLPFVLASDAHSPARPPLLAEGAGALAAAGLEADRIREAVDTGPERLLAEGLPS